MHMILSGQVQCILASPNAILNNQMAQDMLLSPICQCYLAAVMQARDQWIYSSQNTYCYNMFYSYLATDHTWTST